MSLTCITLTRDRRDFTSPAGCDLLVHRNVIDGPADYYRAWSHAALSVRTTHFFFLDDDDSLEGDVEAHLTRLVDARAGVAYTDEVVQGDVRRSAPYSQALHLRNPQLVHHLAVFETKPAQCAILEGPHGAFWPEMAISWLVAKRAGAHYLPESCYQRPLIGGLSRHPQIVMSQMRTALWCKENP